MRRGCRESRAGRSGAHIHPGCAGWPSRRGRRIASAGPICNICVGSRPGSGGGQSTVAPTSGCSRPRTTDQEAYSAGCDGAGRKKPASGQRRRTVEKTCNFRRFMARPERFELPAPRSVVCGAFPDRGVEWRLCEPFQHILSRCGRGGGGGSAPLVPFDRRSVRGKDGGSGKHAGAHR